MKPETQALLSDLGRRLRETRRQAGLTVSELARRADVSRRHVTEAEAGRANLSIAKLAALASALEVPVARLFSYEIAPARRGRIALVGLRGAGKSTIGAKLALALEVPFVELDRRIEELAGLAMGAIFDLHGAAGFRRLEAEALEKVLAEGERMVLAAPGSIVASHKTFERLRSTCRTVWLRASPEEHYRRVIEQGDRRPMRGRPRAMEELKAILTEREPAYGQCEVEVDTTGRPAEGVVESLMDKFGA